MDIQELQNWQALVGALMGAAIPIVVILWLRWRDRVEERRENILKVETFLVVSINELVEFRDELNLFLDRLDKLILGIESDESDRFYFGTTNMPGYYMEYNIDSVEVKIKSLYLTNKLLRSYSMLKSINSAIVDFKKEFNLIIDRNFNIILSYKDPSQNIGITADNQKSSYLDQLTSFREVIKDVIVDKNLPTAIESMVKARVMLLKYNRKLGWIRRIYFEGFGGNILKKENGQEDIEKKIKKEVEGQMNKLNK